MRDLVTVLPSAGACTKCAGRSLGEQHPQVCMLAASSPAFLYKGTFIKTMMCASSSIVDLRSRTIDRRDCVLSSKSYWHWQPLSVANMNSRLVTAIQQHAQRTWGQHCTKWQQQRPDEWCQPGPPDGSEKWAPVLETTDLPQPYNNIPKLSAAGHGRRTGNLQQTIIIALKLLKVSMMIDHGVDQKSRWTFFTVRPDVQSSYMHVALIPRWQEWDLQLFKQCASGH